MENPFKKILSQEELPKMLKQKVIDDISLIKLTIDITDLFVIKSPGTIESFLKKKKKDN